MNNEITETFEMRRKEKYWDTQKESAQPNNKNTQEKINKKRLGNEKIRDARIDHYELIEMESAFRRNLITYEFNGDENKTLSLNEYLEIIGLYLKKMLEIESLILKDNSIIS